jgi:hypothetical protein
MLTLALGETVMAVVFGWQQSALVTPSTLSSLDPLPRWEHAGRVLEPALWRQLVEEQPWLTPHPTNQTQTASKDLEQAPSRPGRRLCVVVVVVVVVVARARPGSTVPAVGAVWVTPS